MLGRRRSCCCGGSGGGSLTGSSGSGGLFTCCEDVLGDYPGGTWPATLNMTLSEACCSQINSSHSVPIYPAGGIAYNCTVSVDDCGGIARPHNGVFYCENGIWRLIAQYGGNVLDVFNCGNGPVDVTLFSCDPFHAVVVVPYCTGALGIFCDGTVKYEFTE